MYTVQMNEAILTGAAGRLINLTKIYEKSALLCRTKMVKNSVKPIQQDIKNVKCSTYFNPIFTCIPARAHMPGCSTLPIS